MREQLASIWRDLEEYICCTLLGVIMTLLMMQVCYRYFGGKSIAWSEEVSRFLFLYLVYFAASLAASKNLHIRVTAQLKLLQARPDASAPYDGHHRLVFCIIVVNVGTDFIISRATARWFRGADARLRYVCRRCHRLYLQAVRLVERWWRIAAKRDP
ncbi:MAG: TRAP transporter small permease [Bilophila wadsworthia]